MYMFSPYRLFTKGVSKVASLFKKGGNNPRKLLTTGSLDLHDTLKNSYKPDENFGKEHGYELDKELSNHNQQILYNKKTGHMVMSVAGTHNLNDVKTDASLMGGKLKSTDRYREAEMTLKKAKAKHNPTSTTGVGHSLGGSIISKLDLDKKVTLDKGSELGATTGKSEVALRSSGDLVSIFGAGNKHMTTIHKEGFNILRPSTWRKAHDVSNIKDSKFKVPV